MSGGACYPDDHPGSARSDLELVPEGFVDQLPSFVRSGKTPKAVVNIKALFYRLSYFNITWLVVSDVLLKCEGRTA